MNRSTGSGLHRRSRLANQQKTPTGIAVGVISSAGAERSRANRIAPVARNLKARGPPANPAACAAHLRHYQARSAPVKSHGAASDELDRLVDEHGVRARGPALGVLRGGVNDGRAPGE